MVDLTLEPIYLRRARISVGILSTGGVRCFGRWHGTIRFDGQVLKVNNLVG